MNIGRIQTGIKELDEVLLGGFPANSINIVMGEPGTGKTIVAEQLVFANATAERPALYLTTLSEPLEKFIAHGQSYRFFDSAKVGETVFYEDLGLMLRERGLDALTQIITEMVVEREPRIVVIDSFKALNDLGLSGEQRRTLIFDLASVLSSYECTSFLVGEYSLEMMTELPEFAIADSVLHLIRQRTGGREQRFLCVEKLRSSAALPGMHAFSITGDGIEVFPRLLTPPLSSLKVDRVKRVNTGIAGLDQMVEAGFWSGSTTLVAGPTGSGKTIIGLHFIREGARTGAPGLYVGFQETPAQLLRIMQNFGWEAEEMLQDKSFELMYRSPVEMQLDSVAVELFRRVREGRIKRVVIDALGELRRCSVDAERFSDYIYILTQWFAAQGVTCLMMFELDHLFEFHHISDREVSTMSDNILLLRFTPDAEMARTIRIIKMRGSGHDHREHLLQISSQGLVIGEVRL